MTKCILEINIFICNTIIKNKNEKTEKKLKNI